MGTMAPVKRRSRVLLLVAVALCATAIEAGPAPAAIASPAGAAAPPALYTARDVLAAFESRRRRAFQCGGRIREPGDRALDAEGLPGLERRGVRLSDGSAGSRVVPGERRDVAGKRIRRDRAKEPGRHGRSPPPSSDASQPALADAVRDTESTRASRLPRAPLSDRAARAARLNRLPRHDGAPVGRARVPRPDGASARVSRRRCPAEDPPARAATTRPTPPARSQPTSAVGRPLGGPGKDFGGAEFAGAAPRFPGVELRGAIDGGAGSPRPGGGGRNEAGDDREGERLVQAAMERAR